MALKKQRKERRSRLLQEMRECSKLLDAFGTLESFQEKHPLTGDCRKELAWWLIARLEDLGLLVEEGAKRLSA